MLSIYVVKSTYQNKNILYHTVTKKWLPDNCTGQELKNGYFLQGQEKQALHSVFAENRDCLSLTITPTWECNLRCKHCSVLNNLKLKDDEVFPVDKLFAFIEQYIDVYHPKYVTFDFVGGEPLLRPKVCTEIIKRAKSINSIIVTDTTTNLSIDLDEDCMEFFEIIDSINVSIDGNHEQHNSQRIPLLNTLDPYQKTHDNLEILLDAGHGDKISLKAALKDEFITKETYEEFLRKYAYMGIDINKIKFGCLHPTEHIKTSYNEMLAFQQSLQQGNPIPVPCCKYRTASVFQIEPSGAIFDVPFRWARSQVGTLDQSLSEIIAVRQQMIEESFVCFQDPKCMECPVIGYCWGGCVNGQPLHKGRPSDYCNQKRLQERVMKMAEDGEIVHHTERQRPANILDLTLGKRIPLECVNR